MTENEILVSDRQLCALVQYAMNNADLLPTIKIGAKKGNILEARANNWCGELKAAYFNNITITAINQLTSKKDEKIQTDFVMDTQLNKLSYLPLRILKLSNYYRELLQKGYFWKGSSSYHFISEINLVILSNLMQEKYTTEEEYAELNLWDIYDLLPLYE